MKHELKRLIKDLENEFLPKNLDNIDKLHCGELKTGKRIYWYYNEDKEFFEGEGEDVKNHLRDIFSGIVIPVIGTENNHGELDFDGVVVVVDNYPTEGEYCEVDWVSLGRLLDDENLVEVISDD